MSPGLSIPSCLGAEGAPQAPVPAESHPCCLWVSRDFLHLHRR